MNHSRRRLTVIAVGALFVAATSWAFAQQQKVHRVAFIATVSPVQELNRNPAVRAFVSRLRDLGYVEGRNLHLDLRSLEGRYERGPELLADVVRLKPDVIFSATQVILERSRGATGNVPVVTLATWSIVETGLARSFAWPGGTITGQLVDIELGVEAKRLELLRELLPQTKRVAFLAPSLVWDGPQGKQVRAAAQRLGVTLVNAAYVGTDVQAAFAAIEREAPDAVFVAVGPSNYGHGQKIGEFVSARRLPCTAGAREVAEYGCLMSYGVDVEDLMHRAAGSVAKILAGAKPGDLPIEQPSKFDFVINAKAARAIGITIPQSILVRADRVLE
jgi:putative tryptophan/tyrosine transport system substrate-binding protein